MHQAPAVRGFSYLSRTVEATPEQVCLEKCAKYGWRFENLLPALYDLSGYIDSDKLNVVCRCPGLLSFSKVIEVITRDPLCRYGIWNEVRCGCSEVNMYSSASTH
eukprot:17459-Heterococcus_DN1.PRE.5